MFDSITQVGDEAGGVWVLDLVAMEDTLALVLTQPVASTAHLALVGDHCAGNCAEIGQNQTLQSSITIYV